MLRIEFRGYQDRDLEALQALDAVCFSPTFRFSRTAMRRFAAAWNALVRLAHEPAASGEETPLVGFCIVHLQRGAGGERVGYVVTLDVAPRWRGQGVGERLMASLEELARARGAVAMTLHVAVANTAAVRLYARLGYVRCGVEGGFYAEGGDAFIYRKELPVDPSLCTGAMEAL